MAAIVAARTGKGYWEVATDGRVFAFGRAKFYGSLLHRGKAGRVVAAMAASNGTGYWLVTQDSEVYAFGSIYGRIGDFAMLTVGKVVQIIPDPARPQPLPVAVVGDSLVWQAENTIIHSFDKDRHIKAKIVANPGHALSSTWVQTKLVQA